MHLMSGRWPGSGRDHPPIRSLKVLRSQTVEAVLSDTGNQMNSDSDPVGVIAALPDRRWGDVLKPVLEPAGDGPSDAPGSGMLPFSRFFSSSRTLAVTTDLDRDMTCRRSGFP
jgi:hypothetical protein